MVNENILDIANQASLKISATEKIIYIQHKYRLSDKSIWGVLLLLIGGAFFIIVPFIKTSDTTSKVLGNIIGLSFISISILTLFRQVTDRLKITDKEISFRYNLKLSSILIDRNLKVIMKTEIMEINRVGTIGSTFIIVTHYLKTIDKEIPILKFQMENSDADKAIMLGNEITRITNNKFRQFN
jgi:hypothetical protein